MSWFTESNRYKHFLFGMPTGLFTILFTLGIATGMEFKDVHHDNGNRPIKQWSWKCWDWLDWLCTIAGGVLGNLILIITIYVICRN